MMKTKVGVGFSIWATVEDYKKNMCEMDDM